MVDRDVGAWQQAVLLVRTSVDGKVDEISPHSTVVQQRVPLGRRAVRRNLLLRSFCLDEKMEQLCNNLEDFKDNFDLEIHILYLFSEHESTREMVILEVRDGNFVCRLGSPNASPFVSELTIKVNAYFVSEEGNLVRVVYRRR